MVSQSFPFVALQWQSRSHYSSHFSWHDQTWKSCLHAEGFLLD
jgi:hypothetical protein